MVLQNISIDNIDPPQTDAHIAIDFKNRIIIERELPICTSRDLYGGSSLTRLQATWKMYSWVVLIFFLFWGCHARRQRHWIQESAAETNTLVTRCTKGILLPS